MEKTLTTRTGMLAASMAWLTLTAAAPALAGSLELSIGMYRVVAEVAHTPPLRERGLMERTSVPANAGMLFIHTQPGMYCMWMKNTRIPLSVAFLDESGRILNVAEMQPMTLDSHCPVSQARYALEMNAGWFSQRHIQPGMSVSGLERAPQPR